MFLTMASKELAAIYYGREEEKNNNERNQGVNEFLYKLAYIPAL